MTKTARRLILSVLAWCLVALGGTGPSMADTASSTALVGYAYESLTVSYHGSATTASCSRNGCENSDYSVYDGFTHVLMDAVEVRAWPGSLLAAKGVTRTVDPNKLHHIFGRGGHGLDDVVKAAGSREAAFEAMEKAAQGAFDAGKLVEIAPGVFGGSTIVGGMGVTVRGAVVDGVFRIGSAWR